MPNYPYPVPEGVEIVWETDVRDDRQDACWYMDTNAIATVTYKDRTIYVDRNGELSIESTNARVKNSDDLEAIGITNDIELMDADLDLNWLMNPWFDSYEATADGDVDHLDFVEYSAYDAVSRAVEYIIGDKDA